MHLGPYLLDSRRNVLASGEAEIPLSPLAARLLNLLGDKPGEVVERSTIIDTLWRGDWVVGDPALNRLVSEIRRAVGDDPRNPKLIQTVPRLGYHLVATNGATHEPNVVHPAPPEPEPEPVTAPAGAPPPSMPRWREVWSMINATLIILFCGVATVLGFAAMAHN